MNFYTKILNLKNVDAAEPITGLEKLALIPLVRHWIEHIPQPPKTESVFRPYQPSDLDQCLHLLNQYQHKPALRLARIWTKAELAKQLLFQDFNCTWVCTRHDRIRGLINYHFMTLRGKINIQVAVMDEVHLENMTLAEQKQLLAVSLQHLKTQQVTALITQNTAYYPRPAFRWARFIPYPRRMVLVALAKKPGILNKLPDIKARQLYLEHR